MKKPYILLVLFSIVLTGCATLSEPVVETTLPITDVGKKIILPVSEKKFTKDRFFKKKKKEVKLTNDDVVPMYRMVAKGFELENTDNYMYLYGVYRKTSLGNMFSDSYIRYTFDVDCKKNTSNYECIMKAKNAKRYESNSTTAERVPEISEIRAINEILKEGVFNSYELTTKYDQDVIYNELQARKISASKSGEEAIRFTFPDDHSSGTISGTIRIKKSKDGYRVPVIVNLKLYSPKNNTYDYASLDEKAKNMLIEVLR